MSLFATLLYFLIQTHVHTDLMSDNIRIIAISGGTVSGGLLLLLILVAAISTIVCLLLRYKRKAYHSNMSMNVAYCTSKRSELDETYVNSDCNYYEFQSVPTHTNAAYSFSKPPTAVVYDVVYDSVLPNLTEHQFQASGMVLDKDCITNAAYTSSKLPLAVELEVVYDTIPDTQQMSAHSTPRVEPNVAYESTTVAVSPNTAYKLYATDKH